ncbi:ankyrin repeat-containing domain protein [Ilyonectria destructans]|nr:ankyrin repeat-containing domain protein [Ilyonectria destructans]
MRLALAFALAFLSLFGCHIAAAPTFHPRLPPAEADLERQIYWDSPPKQSDIDFVAKYSRDPLPDSGPEPWYLGAGAYVPRSSNIRFRVLPEPVWYKDPAWFDPLGRDPVDQLRIFGVKNEDAQVQHVLRLLDEFPSRGPDLLHKAAVNGKPNVIRTLLERGVDPALKAEDYWGQVFIIHAAAENGCVDCVNILVTEAGVDPDLVDDCYHLGCRRSGWTPLITAVIWGHQDVVEWLLNTGRVNTTRELFWDTTNPLELAVTYQPHLVQLLLDHPKAKENRRALGVTEEEYLGPRILTLAASGGDARLFRRLLSRLGYPTARDDSSRAWMGHLLTDAQGEKLKEAFHEAVRPAHVDVVRLLLENYLLPPGDPDIPFLFDTRMVWSLMEGTESAIEKNDTETFDFLLGLIRHPDNGNEDCSRTRYHDHLSDCLDLAAAQNAPDI